MAGAAPADVRFAHLLDIEREIAALNHAARNRVKVLAERFSADVQPAGFGVLRYVIDNGPVRAGGIASALGMDKSSVSRQITALRDIRLLDVRPDPIDGRAALLVATEEACTALTAFRDEIRADYERTLAGWDSDDVAQFSRLLERFNRSLG